MPWTPLVSSVVTTNLKSTSNCKHWVSPLVQFPVEIRCPMFGSGLAGGNWAFIEELIDEIWIGDYNVPVTVCALSDKDLP